MKGFDWGREGTRAFYRRVAGARRTEVQRRAGCMGSLRGAHAIMGGDRALGQGRGDKAGVWCKRGDHWPAPR